MKWFWKLLAAGAAMTASAAYAQDAQVYKQSGAWALDYGDDYCRLAGTFANGKDELALAMERIQPGPFVRTIIIGGGLRPYRRATQVGYNFLPGGGVHETPLLRSQTPDGSTYLNLGSMSLVEMPRPGENGATAPRYNREAEQSAASGITGIELASGLTTPVRIETGELGAPIAALQTCTDELLTYWGLDAAKHQTLSRPVMPAGSPAGWLPTGTVGFADFQKLMGGQNAIRLMVDDTGKPTDCKVHWDSLGAAKNEAICKALMSNAKFQPALDADGNAMASYWTTEVFFLMPGPGGRR